MTIVIQGKRIEPGMRVRVTQRITGREETWQASVEGEVMSLCAEPTGSWFAHGKDGRYRLGRIRLRKSDGEITRLVLDPNSRVELLPG
ncbi:MAG TPA: hypothetical protein PLC79_06955 [Phycisphaerae bacterium]|nr:hypothetical protein [Phycisphaerae bacterium]